MLLGLWLIVAFRVWNCMARMGIYLVCFTLLSEDWVFGLTLLDEFLNAKVQQQCHICGDDNN